MVRVIAITSAIALIASCGPSGPGPTAIEAPPTPESTPMPTPSPNPTPRAKTALCQTIWDRAGEEFSYDPDEYTHADAQGAFCGTLAPVEGLCPEDRETPWTEFSYDPDDETAGEAVERHCGLSRDERMIDAECPINRDSAGLEFSYDPAAMSSSEARDIHCGSRAPITNVCPSTYMRGGAEYTYDPDDMGLREAVEAHCGRPRSILNSCELLDDTVQEQVKKGTRSIRGNCYFMGVHVYQFDANTGPCSFLGSFSRFDNRGFSLERLAQYGYSDEPDFHWLVSDCPALDEVFAGDNIVVDAVFVGPYTYETTGGLFRTVPAFEVLRVR